MKFGRTPLGEARGAILAHTLRAGGAVFKKGRVLGDVELEALRAAGYAEVVAARLAPGDVPEDEAAATVARAVAGGGLTPAEPFTGRANLHADHPGVLVVDAARVDALNAVDESLTLATLAPYARVEAGELAATVKVIPFAAPARVVAACAAVGPAVRVAPFAPRTAGLVLTRLPGVSERLLDGPSDTLRTRVERLGGRLAGEIRCDHHEDEVAAAISAHAAAGCDLILVMGASAPTDRGDVIPAAVERSGGEVLHLGMPVDPGNLLVLGRRGGADVLGVPGCARSLKPSGFDWVLERLAAGLEVRGRELAGMGVGGLLKEVAARPQPRSASRATPARPRVAALVLAAGLSRRMGENKLLVDVDGLPMVARAVDAVLASPARPVVVVTGHQEEAVRAALAGRAVTFAHNPDPAAGMSGSLRVGLAAVGNVDAAVVCLGDMPWVRPRDIAALLDAFDPAAGRSICVPAHAGKRGNPVLWAARFFPQMMSLGGDAGARQLLEEHAGEVHAVAIEDPGVLLDVDTREALAARVRP